MELQKNNKKVLEEYKESYIALFEHGIDAIIIVDDKSNISEVNARLSEFTSFSVEELLKMKLIDLIADEDRKKFKEQFNLLSTESVVYGTLRLTRKNGTPIVIRYCASMFSSGKYQYLVHNETSCHYHEKELIQRNKEAVALYEIGRQIATSVDIDRVLSSIVNNTIWLLECQFVGVALLDVFTNTVSYRALAGNKTFDVAQLKMELGKELPGIAVSTKASFLIREFPNDPPVDKNLFPILSEEGICSAFCVPLSSKGKVFGALVTGYRSQHDYTDDEIRLISNLADQSSLAIENARLYQTSLEHTKALEMLTVRLSKIQEAERHRISRELHDTVGQALTGLHLNLDLFANEAGIKEPKSFERLRSMKLIINETLKDIRQMAFELRPTILDDFGIIPALRLYLDRFSKQTNIKTSFKYPEKLGRNNPQVEATIYRVAQEAITNVAKHSLAKNVNVVFSVDEAILKLDIIDDGIGFEADRLQRTENLYKGLGILSMRERISEVNGVFKISSQTNKGTNIHIEIPLRER